VTGELKGEFDYIVVGAGSSGSALAARLTEDPSCRVLVLEAGAENAGNFWLRIPLGVGKVLSNPALVWPFFTEPEKELGGRKISSLRGRGLGGSGAVNGLAWVRGEAAEYDRWRASGLEGWGFEDVLPFLKKMEDYPYGDPKLRGRGGPIKVIDRGRWDRDELSEAYRRACIEAGIPENDDYNGENFEGVGFLQQSISSGLRCSGWTAYLRPARNRPNLTIVTGATATRVLFESKRACGVEFVEGGTRRTAKARCEGVLSAGAVKSPQLLELSGVGDAARLASHGIPVVAHVPGVGEDFHEHLQFRFTYECTKPITINDLMASPIRKLSAGAKFVLTRRGLLSGTSSTVHALAKSDPRLESPDLKIQLALISGKDRMARSKSAGIDEYPGFSIGTFKIRPESRGSVHIRSADPLADPAMRVNYLTHPGDIETYRRAVVLMRKIAAQPSLAPYIKRETRPGPEMTSIDGLIDYIRETGQTAWHAGTSCRMGVDDMAVTDARLRVRGVTGLRVVDISVMPTIVSPNTNAPAFMIGEKAADMILRDRRATPGERTARNEQAPAVAVTAG
jgi:choline dehydrogenase